MRRIRTDNALSASPAGGHVEVFQARKNASKNAAPQGLPLSVLIAEAVAEGGLTFDTFAELDALVADESLVNVAMIDTLSELNALIGDATLLDSAAVQPIAGVMTPGSGWDSVGVYHSSVEKVGDFFKTTIYVDLTGAKSATTEDDIIGSDKGADIVVNGDLAADSDWTYGADWSFDTNKIDCAAGAGTTVTPAIALVPVIGKTYELTYTMSSFVAGTCVGSFGGQDFTARGSDATFVERIVATTTDSLVFTGVAASDFQIDDISLKEVPLAHLGQITAALNGTLFDGEVTWFETPNGGVTDIDFWSAPEASGAFDDPGKTDLTEVVIYAKGSAAAGARATQLALTNLPAADDYIYAFAGVAGTAGTYDAGILKFVFWGT